MSTMKAVRVHQFGGPEVLSFEEVEIPAAGPGQVRTKSTLLILHIHL
jgi:NADPH:quinone reductase